MDSPSSLYLSVVMPLSPSASPPPSLPPPPSVSVKREGEGEGISLSAMEWTPEAIAALEGETNDDVLLLSQLPSKRSPPPFPPIPPLPSAQTPLLPSVPPLPAIEKAASAVVESGRGRWSEPFKTCAVGPANPFSATFVPLPLPPAPATQHLPSPPPPPSSLTPTNAVTAAAVATPPSVATPLPVAGATAATVRAVAQGAPKDEEEAKADRRQRGTAERSQHAEGQRSETPVRRREKRVAPCDLPRPRCRPSSQLSPASLDVLTRFFSLVFNERLIDRCYEWMEAVHLSTAAHSAQQKREEGVGDYGESDGRGDPRIPSSFSPPLFQLTLPWALVESQQPDVAALIADLFLHHFDFVHSTLQLWSRSSLYFHFSQQLHHQGQPWELRAEWGKVQAGELRVELRVQDIEAPSLSPTSPSTDLIRFKGTVVSLSPVRHVRSHHPHPTIPQHTPPY